MKNVIPRRIWTLWLQGRRNAPAVVQSCFDSWERMNPSWELVVLDEASLGNYVDIDEVTERNRKYITRQAKSDIVRISLLAQYGGVWADSTCLCMVPLDTWLAEYGSSGFFAFERPGPDRLISSWFLASSPHCYLTQAYKDLVDAYWSNSTLSGTSSRVAAILVHRLRLLTRKNALFARLWFTRAVREGLKAYPYFWFHYLFAELVTHDHLAREIWASTPKLSAAGPHRLRHHGLLAPPSPAVRSAIDERRDPTYKLKWKLPIAEHSAASTLHYALGSIGVLDHLLEGV